MANGIMFQYYYSAIQRLNTTEHFVLGVVILHLCIQYVALDTCSKSIVVCCLGTPLLYAGLARLERELAEPCTSLSS